MIQSESEGMRVSSDLRKRVVDFIRGEGNKAGAEPKSLALAKRVSIVGLMPLICRLIKNPLRRVAGV